MAILLRFAAGASYIHAVLRGRARPNLVSWFFWGFTALVAFAVQVSQHTGSQAFVTLAIGMGPVMVFTLALVKGKHDDRFTATDRCCAALTVIGIILWLGTRKPLVALAMSMTVDFVSGIPTIVKSYQRPHSEHALPYCLSVASMFIALLTVRDWRVANWAFTAYILGTNLVFSTLIISKIGPRIRQLRTSRIQLTLGVEEA